MVLCAALALGVLAQYMPGLDYQPLVIGLRAELAGGSAYSPEVFSQVLRVYAAECEPCAQAGFGYPLPAVWLALPVAWLPPALAKSAWCAISGLVLCAGLRLNRLPLFLALFLPAALGMWVLNVTVLITGLLLVGVWALRERRLWLLSLIVALTIAAKPQASALLALALLVGGVRAGGWRQMALCIGAVLGATAVLDPLWPLHWLQAVRSFADALEILWLFYWLPVGVGFLLARKTWVGLALIQACLFPLSWNYTFIPLLLGLVDSVRVWPMVLMVAVSLLMPLTMLHDWLPFYPPQDAFLVLPMAIAVSWSILRERFGLAPAPRESAPRVGGEPG